MGARLRRLWSGLRRSLADGTWGAGGDAVIEPLGLLAIEREHVAAARWRNEDGAPQPTDEQDRAGANQCPGNGSGAV
jgi:hypothetical protein